MMSLVQLAVFAFFVKRVHDCGAAGWAGALAQVFGWSLLSGFLAVLLMFFGGYALTIAAGQALLRATFGTLPSTKKERFQTKDTGPLESAFGAVTVVLQVLLMLWFTRCA
jgi:hypothetical protein